MDNIYDYNKSFSETTEKNNNNAPSFPFDEPTNNQTQNIQREKKRREMSIDLMELT